LLEAELRFLSPLYSKRSRFFFLTNSISAIRFENRQGRVVARLYDDGTHGDEIASDLVYSGRFLLSANEVSEIQFVVSAAYRNGLRRLWSSPFAIKVVNEPSVQELDRVIQTQQRAGQSFATLRNRMGDDQARALVLSNLRGQPNVASTGISSDGHTSGYVYNKWSRSEHSDWPTEHKSSGNSASYDAEAFDVPQRLLRCKWCDVRV